MWTVEYRTKGDAKLAARYSQIVSQHGIVLIKDENLELSKTLPPEFVFDRVDEMDRKMKKVGSVFNWRFSLNVV